MVDLDHPDVRAEIEPLISLARQLLQDKFAASQEALLMIIRALHQAKKIDGVSYFTLQVMAKSHEKTVAVGDESYLESLLIEAERFEDSMQEMLAPQS